MERISKEKLSEKQCKVCGSRKWVCYSNNFGQDWYCWGHRPNATDEERRKEDERQNKTVRKDKPKTKRESLDQFF